MKGFERVIGYESVVRELVEYCDVVKNFQKYKEFGACVPSGILLEGNVGLGKTLMANCFLDACGQKSFVVRKDRSEEELILHIKDVFQQAKKCECAVILFDDLDKFANDDEVHQNSDAFVTIQTCIDECKNDNIFIIATLNSATALPSSLLRCGRFDKRIELRNPHLYEAEKIVQFYLKDKKVDNDVDSLEIAKMLIHRNCAELETVVNEAAIYAAYNNQNIITMQDIRRAILRVIFGNVEVVKNTKDEKNAASEKNLLPVAYHEAGHLVVSEILEKGSVNLCSICEYEGYVRGFVSVHKEDNYFFDVAQQENRIIQIFGGKAAYEKKYKKLDCGAESDIDRAVNITKRLVCENGLMGLDNIDLEDERHRPIMDTNKLQNATRKKMKQYHKKAKKIIYKNWDKVEKIVAMLMEKITITQEDIKSVMEN